MSGRKFKSDDKGKYSHAEKEELGKLHAKYKIE